MKTHLDNAYRNISDWHHFRLRLFAEGILIGLFSGLIICFFRFALHIVEYIRYSFYLRLHVCPWHYHLIWICALLAVAFFLNWLNKKEPMAAGSGIPQVKGAILGLMKMRWFSIIWVKLLGGILGIGAGLSLGREGPSIQLGAVAAQGISRTFGRTRLEERYLLTSGASAGLAAAFNAPLAGVIFALEELHRNFSIVVLLPAMAAAFTATMLSRALFGRASIFEFPDLQIMPLEYYSVVILIAAVVSLAGVLFNKGLLNIGRFYALPIFSKPVYKIIFALGCSILVGYTLPQVLGGGNALINNLAKAPASLQMLVLLLVAKFIFTLISYGCGTPGGFFLPMLVIGALCGSVCASILISLGVLPAIYATNIVVISMAALFSSSVRAPITGTVLIMEMTSSYQQLLSLAIAAMVSFVIAEFCKSKPIYEELLSRSLKSHRPEEKTLQQQSIVELSVCSGSLADNKLVMHVPWPKDAILVEIKRGEEQIIPKGDTLIKAGDFLYVFTHNGTTPQLNHLVSEQEDE